MIIVKMGFGISLFDVWWFVYAMTPTTHPT